MITRVDAHQHFWTLARGDYGWLTSALAPLYRDVEPAELRPLLARHSIDATILVQAAPTEAETRFLLGIADDEPFVQGVVGWTDLAAPSAAATIEALARHSKLKGLRPMLHDLLQDDWVDVAPISAALEAMASCGLVFDALVRPANLAALQRRVARHPGLNVVVDHAAKPEISATIARTTAGASPIDADAGFVEWADAMRALAAMPNVHCKLSGLLTEAPKHTDAATLRPWVDVLLDCFGPGRLIWGSDWPVLTLAASYDRWAAITDLLLRDLDDVDRTAILGANAARVYRLEQDGQR